MVGWLLLGLGLTGPADENSRFAHVNAREPYLAIRTGLTCSACHTNVTGGGNRTEFGSVYAQTQLPWRPQGLVRKALTDFLSVGWDLRAEGVAVVQGDPDPRTSAGLDVAQVYLSARFLNERLQLYIDETVGPDRAVAREAFVLVRRLPLDGYAKAGKFLLPFGFRLQDDDEFIRAQTGISYLTPEQGVELGVEPGPLTVSLAVTNGSVIETNSSKRVTSQASVVLSRLRLGASASLDERPGAARRRMVGGFGGVSLGPVVLLGELDFVRDEGGTAPATDLDQLVAYGEVDWLVRRGVNLKVTHGWHDPDRDLAENERTRSRLGLELFPVPFVRLAAFYNLLQDPENRDGVTDNDRVSLEAHLHF